MSTAAHKQYSVNAEHLTLAAPRSAHAEVTVETRASVSTNACPESGTLPAASVPRSSTESAIARHSSIARSELAQCSSQQTAGSSSARGETWILQVQKRHAKTAKDALKALGFLDRHGRVVNADKSAAEVALPLTPAGAASIQAITRSLSHVSLDCNNQNCNRASEEARRATNGACSNGPCDAENMQPDSPTVPVLMCRRESAHTAAMQNERIVLTDILRRGLGRVAEAEVAARTGPHNPSRRSASCSSAPAYLKR